MSSEEKSTRKSEKYEIQAPDGGWGYIIAVAITVVNNVTFMPTTSFGLIFGRFLASIGDETTGTTLTTSLFNTCFNITGLAASTLLQKYSYRVVALLGGAIFFIGSFTTIFVTSLPQLIVSYGVMQGVGFGLMYPSFFTALNFYFDKRLNLINGIAQAFMVAAGMVWPLIIQYLMVTFGFRGTLALLSALSLNTIMASMTLQPVKWHNKKVKITVEQEELLTEEVIKPKPRTSIISLGDRAFSVTTLSEQNKNLNCWQSIVKSLNLELFKDPLYVNISVGLALGFTADIAFISILPLMLMNSGFDSNTTAFFMAVFFGADLVARLSLSVISNYSKLKNRYYFFGGSFLMIIFRTAFTFRDDFYWKISTVIACGFLRCFIQTPLPLVISEQYSENFATAFSLCMVMCGVVSFLFGPLLSFVKAWTHSDVMVVHVLSLAFVAIVVSWSVEMVTKKLRRSRQELHN